MLFQRVSACFFDVYCCSTFGRARQVSETRRIVCVKPDTMETRVLCTIKAYKTSTETFHISHSPSTIIAMTHLKDVDDSHEVDIFTAASVYLRLHSTIPPEVQRRSLSYQRCPRDRERYGLCSRPRHAHKELTVANIDTLSATDMPPYTRHETLTRQNTKYHIGPCPASITYPSCRLD